MAIKLKTGEYGCMFCDESFKDSFKAQAHQDTHDYVLLPILRTELTKLIHWLQISVSSDSSITKGDLIERELYKRMKQMNENLRQNE